MSNEMFAEIQELNKLVNEYKMLHLKDLKDKERHNDLINKENF